MRRSALRMAAAVGALGCMLIVALMISGQEPPRAKIGIPYDWSHRHLIFSNPTTVEGTLRMRQDARYWHQWFRRNVRQAMPVAEPVAEDSDTPDEMAWWWDGDWFGWFRHRRHRPPRQRNALHRDWAQSLGTNASIGSGNYPAKFSFDITTANCSNAAQPDFVVFNTGVTGSLQASIVAYDNLYSGCSGVGSVPATYWAYNTSGSVVTSVALSLDGSQIAFVQTSTTTPVASLALLKWAAATDGATSTNPDSVSVVSASQYPTCTVPCMVLLPFSGGHNDTNSSPFYDFNNDALYAGDDAGVLHKFQPVFFGVPAEVTTGWPVTLASGLKLSSPVFDVTTGRVFVGSAFSGSSGSQLFAVTAASGALADSSASLGKGNGIVSGPIVDSSAGKVYVFVGTDNSPSGTCFTGGPCSGVYQFTASSNLSTSVEATVQRGSNSFTFTLYEGTFDNNYYTSANSTGNLYVCGNSLGTGTLFQIPVTAGTMSTTSAAGPQLSGIVNLAANAPCSPVTEIFNSNIGGPPGVDRIFVSTPGSGSNACAAGCIYDMPVTSWQPNTVYAVGEEVTDRFLNVQVVTTPGTSGSGTPGWGSPGNQTPDGGVTWMCKEGLGTTSFSAWAAHTSYSIGSTILDTNGNVEVQTDSGAMSGATQPTWPAIGGHVSDNAANWTNVGPIDNFLLAVTGGTSGMVVDNIVTSGTLAGGSQVYFSPLGFGFSTCGTGNGCAVQASQAGLQ